MEVHEAAMVVVDVVLLHPFKKNTTHNGDGEQRMAVVFLSSWL